MAVLFSDDAAQFAAVQQLTQRHAELTQRRGELLDKQRAAGSAHKQAGAELRSAEKAADRLQRSVRHFWDCMAPPHMIYLHVALGRPLQVPSFCAG